MNSSILVNFRHAIHYNKNHISRCQKFSSSFHTSPSVCRLSPATAASNSKSTVLRSPRPPIFLLTQPPSQRFSTCRVIQKERGPAKDETVSTTTKESNNGIEKPTVPEIYPNLLALPVARRPFFPGFYKAVVIKDPDVVSAIKELMQKGQPYVGAFLLKDDELDTDKITDKDQVYPVGVFAQITSVFSTGGNTSMATEEHKKENGLTAVLYPHRRIKLNGITTFPDQLKGAAAVTEEVESKVKEEEPAVDIPKTQQQKKEKIEKKSKQSTTTTTPASSSITSSRDKSNNKEDNKENISTTTEDLFEKDEAISSKPIEELLKDFSVSIGHVENIADLPYSKKGPVVRAITSELVTVFKDIAQLNPLFRDQIASFSMSQSAGNVFEDPSRLADFAAAVSAGESSELQEVLATLPVEDRLQKSLIVLKKELMNAQLQNKISKDVESKIVKRQREYYLMEQLKGIKKELGIETDGKDKLVENFKERATKLAMPDGVKKVFDEEINKLAHLEPAASEFNVTRNYLDWITQIPWGKRSRENYNIQHAKKVLDEDHYGLKDVKDRILEFIAVGKLRGTVQGKILCLSGPPGVGKTSVGKSIARALDRQFYRFSVGGLTDVAEIKGHRRTYVGAMPGKVVQALKKVGTENPLILIDEIDKIGRGHQGDPSSALLELLDPEQNSSFLDHYMDIPVDLSKVLFMCTANVLDTIPGPLLDRMEVIQLSGYVAEEKLAIASKYLAPTAKISAGLENTKIDLTQDAIDTLIKNYCRESGVRNLKKQIDKVYRKAALKVVEQVGEDKLEQQLGDSPKVLDADDRSNNPQVFEKATEEEESTDGHVETEKGQEVTQEERKPLHVPDDISIQIDSKSLKDYVGPAIYHSDRMYEKTPAGVVMGLAWTSQGGASLYIESVLESTLSYNSTPHLSKTGQLGDVMKESTTIAYTYAKSLIAQEFPKNKFFERAHVHLHCPAGAVPKDGPSAGITMATALISLALQQPIDPNIAMTGELTVTGKVLQIGGLKEKVIAAKRAQVSTILFPKDNQADWDELEDYIKENMTGIAVDTYDDVFKNVFGNISKEKAENAWAKQLVEPSPEEKAKLDKERKKKEQELQQLED